MLLSLNIVDQHKVVHSESLFEEIVNVSPSLHVVIQDYVDLSSSGRTSLRQDRVLI
ncbi:hypothetical protein KIN20_035404 [Parelaphostrongylus tenuis]|uniref:Uncharacterized protein n=1 Tax=Parelaphostrongylus tenuis TaxID=148309 RepID=A0AAD5WKS9_PARTN|nr:hypothetical protein KIN20_035404 [Parelaphostrongylus tenuis]